MAKRRPIVQLPERGADPTTGRFTAGPSLETASQYGPDQSRGHFASWRAVQTHNSEISRNYRRKSPGISANLHRCAITAQGQPISDSRFSAKWSRGRAGSVVDASTTCGQSSEKAGRHSRVLSLCRHLAPASLGSHHAEQCKQTTR